MYNITLINTKHAELGKCTSSALLEIIKSVNPDVTFEELPNFCFKEYYGDNPVKSTLETIAITDFLKFKEVKQVLIDSIDWPFFKELKMCYNKVIDDFLKLPLQSSYLLKEAIMNNKQFSFEQGFNYLNSRQSEINQTKIYASVLNCSVEKKNKYCFDILNEWDKFTEFRENYMIEAIYKFSELNEYNKAVFTLGVAHRKSIKGKIEEYQEKSRLKLNWKIYGE